MSTLRVVVVLAAALVLSGCEVLVALVTDTPQCDTGYDSPAVRRARSLAPAQLEALYREGIGYAKTMDRGEPVPGEKLPAGFAVLQPLYATGQDGLLDLKLSGCVDRASFLGIRSGHGISLSWGEACADCQKDLWRVPEAVAR